MNYYISDIQFESDPIWYGEFNYNSFKAKNSPHRGCFKFVTISNYLKMNLNPL